MTYEGDKAMSNTNQETCDIVNRIAKEIAKLVVAEMSNTGNTAKTPRQKKSTLPQW